MPKGENTNNNIQGNMSPLEPSHPNTASLKYSNTAKAQEDDLKSNFMVMIEIIKEETKNFLKEMEGKTTKNLEKNQQIP